jgi:signal transduction histidine kinase
MELRSPTRAASASAAEGDFAAVVEQAKLEALYQFAYGLSHEINNPLANIATRAQTLLAEEPDSQRRRALATIVQQAFRAHEMIADLMLFARPPALRPEPTDLVALASTVVAELAPRATEQGTRLALLGDAGPLLATIDSTQIAVALKAIVQNGLEAVKAGGAVEVRVQGSGFRDQRREGERGRGGEREVAPLSVVPRPHFESNGFMLSVTDTGPGIPPDVRPHLFDPFFSGREAGRGLGLGLSKAWRIAELHGGWIDVESSPERGARLAIVLPGG